MYVGSRRAPSELGRMMSGGTVTMKRLGVGDFLHGFSPATNAVRLSGHYSAVARCLPICSVQLELERGTKAQCSRKYSIDAVQAFPKCPQASNTTLPSAIRIAGTHSWCQGGGEGGGTAHDTPTANIHYNHYQSPPTVYLPTRCKPTFSSLGFITNVVPVSFCPFSLPPFRQESRCSWSITRAPPPPPQVSK